MINDQVITVASENILSLLGSKVDCHVPVGYVVCVFTPFCCCFGAYFSLKSLPHKKYLDCILERSHVTLSEFTSRNRSPIKTE